MSTLPLIGITCDTTQTAKGFPAQTLEDHYINAVLRAGGTPILLPHCASPSQYTSMLDGIVVTGGAFDIDPALYGQAASANLGMLKHDRTRFETKLIQHALKHNIPLLGICGGMQLLGVLSGCSMIQHLPDSGHHGHEQTSPKTQSCHPVSFTPNSILSRVYGRTQIMVNSTHHQALTQAPSGIHVSGMSDDGVIESIECTPFAIGVQWHPECLDINDQAPYRWLIDAISRRRKV